MDIDSIINAIDKIDEDRDRIAGRKEHPSPTASVSSIIDIGVQTPNVTLKPVS